MNEAFLKVGDGIEVPSKARLLTLDVRWSAGTQTAFAERVSLAALPLSRGRLVRRDDLVFENQPLSSDGAVRLTSQPGLVEIDLARVPSTVERISIVTYVRPRPNAPRRTLDQLDGLSVCVRDDVHAEELGRSVELCTFLGAVTGATVMDVLREAGGWKAVVQTREHESGLEGAAASAGLRL